MGKPFGRLGLPGCWLVGNITYIVPNPQVGSRSFSTAMEPPFDAMAKSAKLLTSF